MAQIFDARVARDVQRKILETILEEYLVQMAAKDMYDLADWVVSKLTPMGVPNVKAYSAAEELRKCAIEYASKSPTSFYVRGKSILQRCLDNRPQAPQHRVEEEKIMEALRKETPRPVERPRMNPAMNVQVAMKAVSPEEARKMLEERKKLLDAIQYEAEHEAA